MKKIKYPQNIKKASLRNHGVDNTHVKEAVSLENVENFIFEKIH